MANVYTSSQHHYNSSMRQNWWAFIIRGALSIICGVTAILMPLETVLALTLLLGTYILIDSIFCLVSGINRARKGRAWVTFILSGAIGIISGLIMLVAPQVASFSLTILMNSTLAVWALASGALKLAAAVRLRREIDGDPLLVLDGLLSIAFASGVMLLLWFDPVMSLIALGILVGFNFVVSGVVSMFLAKKLYIKNQRPDIVKQTAPLNAISQRDDKEPK